MPWKDGYKAISIDFKRTNTQQQCIHHAGLLAIAHEKSSKQFASSVPLGTEKAIII
jgi:hypothetical protein